MIILTITNKNKFMNSLKVFKDTKAIIINYKILNKLNFYKIMIFMKIIA